MSLPRTFSLPSFRRRSSIVLPVFRHILAGKETLLKPRNDPQHRPQLTFAYLSWRSHFRLRHSSSTLSMRRHSVSCSGGAGAPCPLPVSLTLITAQMRYGRPMSRFLILSARGNTGESEASIVLAAISQVCASPNSVLRICNDNDVT